MRNMSFSLTTEQVRNRTKTVTRRLGWNFLKVGDILNACVKCQGLKKGERVEKICQIRVVSTRRERLFDIVTAIGDERELRKEGFPNLSSRDFVDMFCEANNCERDQVVNRIEFEYLK